MNLFEPSEIPHLLQAALDSGWAGTFEQELITFLSEEYGPLPGDVVTAVLFLSQSIKQGHVCLPLNGTVDEWMRMLDVELPGALHPTLPEAESLLHHDAFTEDRESAVPFLIDNGKLYMRRYRMKELKLADQLKTMANRKLLPGLTLSDLEKAGISFRPSGEEGGEPDWQAIAMLLAIRNQLLILSGGPGTGKTTTIARIIQSLLALNPGPFRIALAAPTGKAAARMSEALRNAFSESGGPMSADSRIPREAMTLHRLLRAGSKTRILPAADNSPLPYDLVVLDEASMADLSMMERLTRHIGESTRLVILGDKDQLSSVEAGAVLGDICISERNRFTPETTEYLDRFGFGITFERTSKTTLEDSIVYLTKSYRFGPESGIAALAAQIRQPEESQSVGGILRGGYGDLEHQEFVYGTEEMKMLFNTFAERYEEASSLNGMGLLNFWQKEIWLTPHRRGYFGTEFLNRLLESWLAEKRLIRPVNGWFAGRPVMITRNDYSLGVFNGDMGVCVPREEGGFSVLFEGADRLQKFIPVQRLSAFEPSWFLTVHKSQGSEFDTVQLLLPEKDSPILTRELLYTAVTRARRLFRLWGRLEWAKAAARRRTERYTGLRDDLYSQND